MRWGLAWVLILAAALAEAADTGPVVTWTDNADDETGFEIERAPYGSQSWSQVGTTGVNVTTWTDTTATPGTRYCWRVRAVNGAGQSGYTGTVCARPVIPSDSGVHP